MNRLVCNSNSRFHPSLAWFALLGGLIAAPVRGIGPSTAPATTQSTVLDEGFVDTDAPAGAAPTTRGSASSADELLLFKDMPVVVAAGMREQTQQQAAASVSVVTANDIELFNYRSLADVLHGQRSFYLDTDGLNWFAGVRGFQRPGEWNARILVLEDGRPTNEIIYGQTHLDQDFLVPMEAVKQVEVIRGPGSALYGTNAVFGVIDLVTKDGADINGIETKVEGGTKDTAHVNLLFGKKFDNGWDIMGDLTGFTSEGDKDIIYDDVTDAAHNFGHIENNDSENVYSAFLKARKGDFTFEADTGARAKDNRAATYLTSWFGPGTMYERRTNITARIDHDFGDGQDLHAMVYYGHYHYSQSWFVDPTTTTPAYHYTTDGQDDWLGEQLHYGWQATKTFHVLAGVDATEALYTRQVDTDTLQGTVLNIPASYSSFGLFAEGELKVTPKLSLTAGARYDQVQRIGGSVSPRFAAIYTATKVDTIKALYGRAFRDPNLYEMLYASPDANTPNPELKPEIVDTFELDWEHQLNNGWRTTLTSYLWKMSDTLDNVSLADGSLQTRNGDDVWADGVEAEADRQWDNGASFRIYGSYTRAAQDGDGLTHSPGWVAGISTAIPIYKSTFISIEPQIVGPMKSDLGDRTSTSFVTNIVFTSRDFVKGWTFQAGAYNLFSGAARLPRDGPFNQIQPTLNYPDPLYLFSISHRF